MTVLKYLAVGLTGYFIDRNIIAVLMFG